MGEIDEDLLDASMIGDLEKAKGAIEKGANVNAKDYEYGRTPLHLASYNGYKSIASLLLEKGADINVKGKWDDWTPLHNASRYGHDATVS
jgi:ankyrin repeat protein